MSLRRLVILVFASFFAACVHQLQFDDVLNTEPMGKQLISVEGFIYSLGLNNYAVSSVSLDNLATKDQIRTTNCIRLVVTQQQMDLIRSMQGKYVLVTGLTSNAESMDQIAQDSLDRDGSSVSINGRYWGGRQVSNCRAKTAIFVKHISK